MNRFIIFLFALVCSLACLSETPKQKVVKVSTATELIRAIKSNTKIVISTEEAINLTEGLDALIASGEIPAIDWDAPELEYGIYFVKEYDGPELIIAGMIDLTIEGPKGKGAHLQVVPRYTNVLRFENCENLVLSNLKLGHTDGGTCSSGVLTLTDCRTASINDCDIYGCGEVGTYICHCDNVTMNNSIIHDCTERALGIDMSDNQSNALTFNNCTFTTCNSGVMVGEDTKNVTFNNCKFSDNKGTLFWLRSLVTLNNCDVEHHHNDESDNDLISRNGGTWVTDFRDAEYLPDIEPEEDDPYEVMKRYAWEGYLNNSVHFRLEAEQSFNNLVIGEMTYFRSNGKVANIPVYGKFMEIGDGEWLILHEYNKRMECGNISIDLGVEDVIYAGTWSYNDKEMKMTNTKKVEFSYDKHQTFFKPAYNNDITGEFGFGYYKSLEPRIEAGGYAKLEVSNSSQVKWQMNNNVAGIAEAEGIAELNGNTFTGEHLNFQFMAYIYEDCLYVVRTNPDDGPVEDWGAAGSLEGVYLRH